MPENRYKKAMDELRLSDDFEAKTQAALARRLREEGAAPPRKKRRGLRAAACTAAALAAIFAVAMIAPGMMTLPWAAKDAPVTDGIIVTPSGAPEDWQAMPLEGANPSVGIASLTGESASVTPDGASFAADEVESLCAAPAAAALPVNTEEYTYTPESGFRSAATEPLSTFAADVDTASYANVRRMLLSGEKPPADAVRVEEMLNYFRYDYPQPAAGEPFSVTTEIGPCPWNPAARLLLVGLQARQVDESARPKSNLVFLIDVSGSMDSPDKLGLVQKAFLMLTEQMKPGDRISIVTYAGEDSVLVEGAGSEDAARIQSAIESLSAGGMTAGSEGIKTAYRIAREQFIEGGNNRVILATDGDLNVGVTSEGALTRLIESEKKSGVFLSVMGFGTGNYKDAKLEALADNGDGNYAYIDSLLEARKVLVEEMGASFFTVCKDVKLQLEFNPDKVSSYRLIGYENRRLAASDFADDAKDGGEIGAGHRVTALYEIVPASGAAGEDGLKYQTRASTGSADYLTVSVRAKAPDGDASRLYAYPVGEDSVKTEPSDNLRFAAAVAQAGMLLRESPYAGSASFEDVARQLEEIPDLRADPYKDEFAYLVRRLARGEIG